MAQVKCVSVCMSECVAPEEGPDLPLSLSGAGHVGFGTKLLQIGSCSRGSDGDGD